MRIQRTIAYISKRARITPADHLSFPFNLSMGNRLHTVKQILEADTYEIVDLKVKICKRKIDTIVADDTGTIKLILWG